MRRSPTRRGTERRARPRSRRDRRCQARSPRRAPRIAPTSRSPHRPRSRTHRRADPPRCAGSSRRSRPFAPVSDRRTRRHNGRTTSASAARITTAPKARSPAVRGWRGTALHRRRRDRTPRAQHRVGGQQDADEQQLDHREHRGRRQVELLRGPSEDLDLDRRLSRTAEQQDHAERREREQEHERRRGDDRRPSRVAAGPAVNATPAGRAELLGGVLERRIDRRPRRADHEHDHRDVEEHMRGEDRDERTRAARRTPSRPRPSAGRTAPRRAPRAPPGPGTRSATRRRRSAGRSPGSATVEAAACHSVNQMT